MKFMFLFLIKSPYNQTILNFFKAFLCFQSVLGFRSFYQTSGARFQNAY